MDKELNRPLPHPADKWDTRFSWLWYNDQEIFKDTEEELDRKIKKFADDGINHLITFSCTHFRWSFYRFWPILTETLAKLVRGCHRHGVYLTEHHSALLTHNPMDKKGEEWLRLVQKKRKSSFENWPGLLEDCNSDRLINGGRMSSMRQVEGSTGELTGSPYGGYMMCPNNPNYRKAYFDYLATLYAVGIDGIMTDDVGFYGQGCACQYCRRLFREKTGFDLPAPGKEWAKWYDDYNSASFRAWLDFRYRSIEDYHLAVAKHYEGLGLSLLRPNYSSHCLNRMSLTSYSLENLPALDWVFQEACYSHVIRYSWIHFLIEQAHRCMVARKRQIPAMISFYPESNDTMIFTWGLALLTGSLFTATPEGKPLGISEKALRGFERTHHDLLYKSVKIPDIAFYDSLRNREQDKAYWHLFGLAFWMQVCILENIQFELAQLDEFNRFRDYKVIVLFKHALLSDEEIKCLRQYALSGGTLLFHRPAGLLDYSGGARNPDWLERLWGFKFPRVQDFTTDVIELALGRGKVVFTSEDVGASGIFVERDGREVPDTCQYLYDCTVDRWSEKENPHKYDGKYQRQAPARQKLAGILRKAIGKQTCLKTENLPDCLLAALFFNKAKNTYVVQLLNAVETFELPVGTPQSHSDQIPFPDLSKYGEGKIRINTGNQRLKSAKAVYHGLEGDGQPVASSVTRGEILVSLPLEYIKNYGFIEISIAKEI